MKENIKQIILDECPFMPGAGTINASGVLKNINGSGLSLTEIFLRETVQNSFDARLDDKDSKTKKSTLNYSLRAFHFNEQQYKSIIELLSTDNKNSYFNTYVRPNINKEMLNIEVSDTNTTGLSGPIEPTDKIGDQNFTNFVYFTGNDKKKDKNSGGSYGFGKAALFAYSKARTIFVYTRMKSSYEMSNRKSYQSRFIVIASDERIENSNSDRCWWGRKTAYTDKERGMYAAPIIGNDADEIAKSLGIEKFGEEQTGTKIIALNAGPDILPSDKYENEKSIDTIFKEDLPKYIVHWYWNKIIDKSINFSVLYENQIIQIDDPTKLYPYKIFCEAYRKLLTVDSKTPDTKKLCKISQTRPSVNLGYVSVVSTPVMRNNYEELFPIFKNKSPIVAFMRGIGNVVYYEQFEMKEDSLETTCYGVFKTDVNAKTQNGPDSEIDHYFRDIENQTHDKWIHRSEVSRYDYSKTVQKIVQEVVLNSCTEEIDEQKAEDISVVIQRILGEKLVTYSSVIGGAKEMPPPDSVQNETSLKKQTAIKETGATDIALIGKNKVISVEYTVTIQKGKKIQIKSVEPQIETIDEEKITDKNIIEFLKLEEKAKDGTLYQFKQAQVELTESGVLKIFVSCHKNCAFNIKIDWEEIDN